MDLNENLEPKFTLTGHENDISKTDSNHHADKLNEADFEYDEELNELVAEEDVKLGTGQFTPDNLIDEDFEAELGTTVQLNLVLNDEKNDLEQQRVDSLREKIDRYNIVNVCGTDLAGRPIIVLSACKLPDESEILRENELFKSHQQFFDLLLEALTSILEQYVECEYTLVYFHYGLKNTSQPSFNWLGKVYKMLDRKFKKNLKALYVVHPTTLFKFLWQFIRPLISSKFHKKVFYCNSLTDLAQYIDLNVLKIPSEVRMYDYQLAIRKRTSYNLSSQKVDYAPFQQFKVPLEHISKQNKGDPVPLCVKETVIYLRKHLDEEGLFRKSGNFERIKQIQELYNQGEPVAYDQNDFHVAASVLKAFVREIPESLLSDSIFNEMMCIQALDNIVDRVEVTRDLLDKKLPKLNYIFLGFLTEFLNQVAARCDKNKMDAKNLSYVFGPNFLRNEESSLRDIEKINNFVELLIKYYAEIFPKLEYQT